MRLLLWVCIYTDPQFLNYTLKKQDGFKIPNSLFLVCVP